MLRASLSQISNSAVADSIGSNQRKILSDRNANCEMTDVLSACEIAVPQLLAQQKTASRTDWLLAVSNSD
jgi:hypothetical protein